MDNETTVQMPSLHSLIPLEDFKALLGFDDREDKLSRFCLLTATYAIEQLCRRRLVLKKHVEYSEFSGDLFMPLREYPVREILAVYALGAFNETAELLEADLYRLIPDAEEGPEDTVYCLSLSPVLRGKRGFSGVKAVYWAGYGLGEAPVDLASACMELAAWNMSRYKGRRIGTTGYVRGSGRDGEHLEMSMPENVRFLLEPYKRCVL
jgi:hypothetical protein